MEAQCFVSSRLHSFIHSRLFQLLRAWQRPVALPSAAGVCAGLAPKLGPAGALTAGLVGERGCPIPAKLRARARRQGGRVWGHTALDSSRNSLLVLFCILNGAPAVNWKCLNPDLPSGCPSSCTLARPAPRVCVRGCTKHLQKMLCLLPIIYPASRKFLVYI